MSASASAPTNSNNIIPQTSSSSAAVTATSSSPPLQSSFIFITSFYSGRTFRIDLGKALSRKKSSSSSPNSYESTFSTITYGTILGLIQSHWKSSHYQKALAVASENENSNKTGTAADSSSSTNNNDSSSKQNDDNAADRNTSNNQTTTKGPAPQTNQPAPPTMDLLLFDASSSSSSNTNNPLASSSSSSSATSQFVAATDEVPQYLLFSGSPNQNLNSLNNNKGQQYILFLLYKPAHRDSMERLLMERTIMHPQDLSPSPSNQVEKGTTALLSIFTHLSSKARHEVEGLLAKIDNAKYILEDFQKTLKSDVNKILALRDGQVAAEIHVTSVESLSPFMAEINANLAKAMSVVSGFDLPANLNSLLIHQQTSSSSHGGAVGGTSNSSIGTKFSPDKCYDAAANARKELKEMTVRLAEANELVTAVFEQFFPKLEAIRSLPEAYPVAEEIARRRVDLYQACTRIQNQLSGEAISIQEQIAGFVQQYGSKFPQSVLRGLDAPVPALHVAYEPLQRSVPVSVDGGTNLLKKFGLLTGGGGGGNASNSSPNTDTEPPSPNTATTFTAPNTASPSVTASFPSVDQNNNNNQNQNNNNNAKNPFSSAMNSNNSSATNTMNSPSGSSSAATTMRPEGTASPPNSVITQENSGSSSSSPPQSVAVEHLLQIFKLSEEETEKRRQMENEAAEERLDVTALRSVEEKNIDIVTAPASTNVFDNSSESNKSVSNFSTIGNFFRTAVGNNTNKADSVGAAASSSSSLAPTTTDNKIEHISTKEYSLAVTFDIARMLSLWNIGEDEYRNQIRNELTILLSPAIFEFQRPVESRPAFAIALGGMFRVSWSRGDASPSAQHPKNNNRNNTTKTKGRVVAVDELKVLEDANRLSVVANQSQIELTTALTGAMPLLELVCEVKRVV